MVSMLIWQDVLGLPDNPPPPPLPCPDAVAVVYKREKREKDGTCY